MLTGREKGEAVLCTRMISLKAKNEEGRNVRGETEFRQRTYLMLLDGIQARHSKLYINWTDKGEGPKEKMIRHR